MRDLGGYWVISTAALIQHCDGVSVFYREADNFTPEVLRLHRPKFVSFQLVSGGQRWHVVGCYISPDDASTIEAVVSTIIQHPRREQLLVAGDFNTNLAAPYGNMCDEEIATDFASKRLEDMSAHFLT